MDSTQLYRFKVIAECESISKAAKGLYISQPALSMMLKDLEDELECKLFLRQGHKLKITDEGKRLLEVANKVSNTIEAAEQEFKSASDHILNLYSSDHYYHAVLPEFTNGIPENLFLRIVANKEIPNFLSKGKSFAAICDDFYLRQANMDDYVKRFLFQEGLYLFVPEGHRWEGLDTLNVQEIENEPLLYFSTHTGFSEWVNDMEKQNKVKFNYAMSLDMSMNAIYQNSITYPRFFSSRVVWDIESVPPNKNCFVRITGEYTQKDIYLWYHKYNYLNFRKIFDHACSRSIELNNAIICFREKIDISDANLKIKHYFS